MPVLSDYLLRSTAVLPGLWVRVVNNATAVAYVSDGSADANGKFTFSATPPIPGAYTMSTSPTGAAPWTATGDTYYLVPVSAGDDAALKSLTLLSSGPYVPHAGLAQGFVAMPYGASSGVSVGPTSVNVQARGADMSGGTDSSAVWLAAQNELPSGGGQIHVPPGILNANPGAGGGVALAASTGPLKIKGAGRFASTIRLGAASAGKDLLHLLNDGCSVEDVTLDTQTNNGQAALFVQANYTSLKRVRILAGSNVFGIFYPGPAGATQAAPLYNIGNVIDDLILNDQYPGDGLSWSFQQQSFIQKVVHTGSRLAIYICLDTEVTGYWWTPGIAGIGGARNGFFITEPSQRIRIKDFHLLGVGIPNIGNPDAAFPWSDVTIEDLYMPTGCSLVVGDGSILKLTRLNLGGNSFLAYLPSAGGTISNIRVTDSIIPQVEVGPNAASTINVLDAEYIACTFPLLSSSQLTQLTTFLQASGTVTQTKTIRDGNFQNAANGLDYAAFQVANERVTGLRGYSPAPRGVGAGASVWTYTNNDGYDEVFMLGVANGITAMTYKGTACSIALGIPYFLKPGDAMTVTWAGSAPNFSIFPAV